MKQLYDVKCAKVNTLIRPDGQLISIGVSENRGYTWKGSIRFRVWEFPKIRGTLFGGPYNKDPII